METEINKFSLNNLASLISPGAILLLFLIWAEAVVFPKQPNYFKDYEILCVFIFITISYLIGILINSAASFIEKRIINAKKYSPRLEALKGKVHWVESLDALYFENTGVHIYDIDKTTQQPKIGDINGKKINKYNLEQFERFAIFYLKKYELVDLVEPLKQQYLLLRNLGVCFLMSALLTIILLTLNTNTQLFLKRNDDFFYNVIALKGLVMVLLVLAIVLIFTSKKQRVIYLESLYRTTRFNYLLKT